VFIVRGGRPGAKDDTAAFNGSGAWDVEDQGTFCPTGGHSEGGGTWGLRQKVWRERGGDLGLVFETP
jgi:hypothetical protein